MGIGAYILKEIDLAGFGFLGIKPVFGGEGGYKGSCLNWQSSILPS
jgi:hypothetical protein